MNTTHTFTYPTYQTPHWTEYVSHESHQECKHFRNLRSVRNQAKSFRCTTLDMSRAQVVKFDDVIITEAHTPTRRGDLIETVTFTTGAIWMVMAPHYGGDLLFLANSLGGSDDRYFSEIEATKGMKKLQKSAAKWNAENDLRTAAADEARKICAMSPIDDGVLAPNDPAVTLGSWVRFHGMGKNRVGVVVGQTATKWVLAYTTPSNPDEIRSTKVGRV